MIPNALQLSNTARNKLDTVRIARFATAREIYRSYLQPLMDSVGETDMNQMILGGELNADDAIAALEEQGVWGYYSKKENTIHAWCGGECKVDGLLSFLGHELEHAVYSCRRVKVDAEERNADLSGAIAATAYRLCFEHFRDIMEVA